MYCGEKAGDTLVPKEPVPEYGYRGLATTSLVKCLALSRLGDSSLFNPCSADISFFNELGKKMICVKIPKKSN